MKIRGSVVSLSFSFYFSPSDLPEDSDEKKKSLVLLFGGTVLFSASFTALGFILDFLSSRLD